MAGLDVIVLLGLTFFAGSATAFPIAGYLITTRL